VQVQERGKQPLLLALGWLRERPQVLPLEPLQQAWLRRC
jgi:hypothetical protein